MKIYYADIFDFPLPDGHRFPKGKYQRLRERIQDAGWISPEDLHIPDAATDDQLLLVHSSDYLKKVTRGGLFDRELRRIGLPWSLEWVERARRSVGGTIAACWSSLETGISINLGGGTHHAHSDHGAGYCLFNDVAVAVRTLQAESGAERLLILDCDVHQGDGTAAIFADDTTVFTFSIHGSSNYPFRKIPSDLDIGLPDRATDDVYLEALAEGLETAFQRADADMVIYLAGADPYKHDSFGRLSLSKAGLAERDRMVLRRCRDTGLPTAIVLSGGYARQIKDTVDIHLNTVHAAAEQFG
jgi:acetoin utilization deacetylase AcuC-like enzyme